IERHGFKRGFEVDSGIERGWFSPGNLADKNCRVSRWDNVERSSQQQEHETGSADVPSKTGAQLEFRFSKFFGSTLGFFDSPTSADVVVNAEAENDRRYYQQRVSGSDQQEFQQQHGILLPISFLSGVRHHHSGSGSRVETRLRVGGNMPWSCAKRTSRTLGSVL